MIQRIYSKRYLPEERKAEKWEESNISLSAEGKEELIALAIEFSKKYKQGMDIMQKGKELTIDLYLTDHFFMGRGKEQLAHFFTAANRIDLSLGTKDVLFNLYYSIE